MSDDNLPAPAAGPVDDAPTYDELVGDISNLIDPDEPDLEAGEEVNEADTDEVADEVTEPDAEDVEQDDAEDEDGSEEPEIKGGRFAPDTAKVTLDDGTVTTVAELKRNNLFQRDYTRKTTELKAEREAFTTERQTVDQQAQSLKQTLAYANWFAEHYLPKEPAPPNDPNDPIAELTYNRELRAYQQQQGLRQYFDAELQKMDEAKTGETRAQLQERLKAEAHALVSKDKSFADRAKYQAFMQEAAKVGGEAYGLTTDDLAGLTDHRQLLILKDALAYRRLRAKAPDVAQQVKGKPPVATGGKRLVPGAKQSSEKQARSERLRRDGSFDNGVAALMDFDL